jgi:hypothetical protein
MSLAHQSSQQPMVDPVYRKVQRAVLALCIILAPLMVAAWFGLCPTGAGDVSCPDGGHSLAVYTAFRSMNPNLMQVFLLLNLVTPFVYPLSYLGLGLLAMKRSPWLATLGIALGWLGSIPWGLFSAQMATLNAMAQIGPIPVYINLETRFYSTWMILGFAIGWVIGHQVAYVLLGSALARARIIPLWAAVVLIISGPIMGIIAYGANLGLLQILGYALVFIGSVPAAIAMLTRRDMPKSTLAPAS